MQPGHTSCSKKLTSAFKLESLKLKSSWHTLPSYFDNSASFRMAEPGYRSRGYYIILSLCFEGNMEKKLVCSIKSYSYSWTIVQPTSTKYEQQKVKSTKNPPTITRVCYSLPYWARPRHTNLFSPERRRINGIFFGISCSEKLSHSRLFLSTSSQKLTSWI